MDFVSVYFMHFSVALTELVITATGEKITRRQGLTKLELLSRLNTIVI